MKKNNKRVFIILSGFNQRAVIAFCRVASKTHIPYKIVAKSANDPILKSDYRKKVILTRGSLSLNLDLFHSIKKKLSKNEIPVLLPSSEYMNRFYLKKRYDLESMGFHIPLVEEDIYNKISDKISFAEICKHHSLHIPVEIKDPIHSGFPLVAKPRRYFSDSGNKQLRPWIINDHSEWNRFIQSERFEDYFYQEFVKGKSLYLLYHISKFGKVVEYSQENLIQQKNGGSIILARSSRIHQEEISKSYKDMLVNEGFHGLIMIELRLRDAKYIMIEANPRLWGPSQLFVDAGIPIFEDFIVANGFEMEGQRPMSYNKEMVYYYWSGGLVEDTMSKGQIQFHEYNMEEYFHDYHKIMACEIYLREDTVNIFMDEQKQLNGRT